MDLSTTYVPEEKAVEILGCSQATLRRYVRTGLLDVIRTKKGRVRIYPLEQLLTIRSTAKKDLLTGYSLHERLNIMASEIQNLSRKLRLVAETLGLHHLHYNWHDLTLTSLFDVAVAYQGVFLRKRPTQAFLDQWLSTVPLLTDVEYRRIAGLHPDIEHPWRFFYKVTEELTRSVRTNFNLRVDQEMDRYRLRLELCMDRIRAAALVQLSVEDSFTDPRRRFAELVQNPLKGSDPQLLPEQMTHATSGTLLDPNEAVRAMQDYYESDLLSPDTSPTSSGLPERADRPRSRRR